MDELAIRTTHIYIYMKNTIEFDLHQFSSIIDQRHRLTKTCTWIFVLLESVGMNVYLYNNVGFECIASCSIEYV